MAAIQAAEDGRRSVAWTETRSDMSKFLHRSRAVRLNRIQFNGADCTGWNLMDLVVRPFTSGPPRARFITPYTDRL